MYKKALTTLGMAAATASAQCNGFTELCDKKYSEVTFLAAHNSAFVGEGPSHNQYTYPENMMDEGIRVFTTQTHDSDGEIKQCHTSCALLDVGYFYEILDSIKGWLDGNPNEVVTLLIANGDNIAVSEYDTVFQDHDMMDIVYNPSEAPSLDSWPTLQELIDAGTRLVVFMDYEADTSSVSYILPEFDHFFETPFSPTEDTPFMNCDADRPTDADTANLMIWANHDLNTALIGDILIPDQDDAPETNSVDNISQQNDMCNDNWGRKANVIMCDFVSIGEVIEAQNALNGLSGANLTASQVRAKENSFARKNAHLGQTGKNAHVVY